MKTRTSISDFNFQIIGYGRYRVAYTSPVTSKQWSSVINDMTLIDDTKNSECPKLKDLEMLKRVCKN